MGISRIMSQSERVHFKIALPVDLKKRLEHCAVDKHRSLSAEIIARLESSFTETPEKDELSGLLNEMRELKDALTVSKATRALLMAELRSAAKASGRTLEDEMAHRIEKGFQGDKPPMTNEIFDLLFDARSEPE